MERKPGFTGPAELSAAQPRLSGHTNGGRFAATLACLVMSGWLAQPAAAQTLSLNPASTAAQPGARVSFDLRLAPSSGRPAAALQWTLSYPAGIASVALQLGTAATAGGKLMECAPKQGAVTCLMAGPNRNTLGAGVVATVSVTIAAQASATQLPLTFTNVAGASPDGAAVSVTSASAGITLPTPAATLTSLICGAGSIDTPGTLACTATLNGAAPAGGATVALASSNGAVLQVPASVSVAGGGSSAGFNASAPEVTADTTATITATLAGVSRSTTVTLLAPAAPPPSGPAGYWTLDAADFNSNMAMDRSGNQLHLAASNVAMVPGRVGQAAAFNGSTSTLAAAGTAGVELLSDLTLAAWIQTVNASRSEALIAKYDGGGRESGYLLKTTAAGTLAVRLGGNNLLAGNREVSDTVAVNDGRWHHVAAVLRLGEGVTFYVDGAARPQQARTIAAARSSVPLQLGSVSSPYFAVPFTGAMDEVRIYRKALTDTEVAQLAGADPGGGGTGDTKPPTVSVTSPAAGQTVSGTVMVSAAATDNVGVAGVQFTVDGAALGGEVAAPFNTAWNTGTVANGPHTLAASARDAAGNRATSTPVTVNVNNVVSSIAPAGYWAFEPDDAIGNQMLDRSGNQLTLVVNDAAPVGGAKGWGLSFNGSRSLLLRYDNTRTDLMGDMTLMAWIRTTNTSRNEAIISKHDAAGSEWGYIFRTTPNGTLGLRLGGNNVPGGGRDVTDIAPVNDGRWHHVAVVIRLGQSVTFYVDGVATPSQSRFTAAARSEAPFILGNVTAPYFAYPFTGTMDEVKIYQAALSAAEIASLAR